MKELMTSPYFGVGLSVVAFWIGEKLHNKLKTPICNPLIVAIVLIVGVLLIFDIPYDKLKKESIQQAVYDLRVSGRLKTLEIRISPNKSVWKDAKQIVELDSWMYCRISSIYGKRVWNVQIIWTGSEHDSFTDP